MKSAPVLLALVLLGGCHHVPDPLDESDTGMADAASADMGDSAVDEDASDGGRRDFTLPFPTFRVGMGGTYANSGTIGRLRRRLMFRFNADPFIGTTAQVVGRSSELDAIFIEDAEDRELGPLESQEIPVFMTTYTASERLGLTDAREDDTPLIEIALTDDHPNFDRYTDAELLADQGEMYVHRELSAGATLFAEGNDGSEQLPLLLGVDTGGALLGDGVAPARRGYFAARDFRYLSIFGTEAVMDAVAWTFGWETPPADKSCGVITKPDVLAGGAFAERLKLHGCDTRIIDPSNVDASGLDLVVIGPDVDDVSVGQLLAPQGVPVIVFYEGTSLPVGFELMPDGDQWEQLSVTSFDFTESAPELLGTPASGSLEFVPTEVNYYAVATDSLVEDVEVLATFPDGQPAVFAVDRDVALTTLDTRARRVFLPTPMIETWNFEDSYSPDFESIEFVDYAIQWALDQGE